MKFCPSCGKPVREGIPEGDTHVRQICDPCGRIFYRNPKVVVGCLPRWEDQVLLCLRAIEPRLDYWTLPSGYLENGETLEEGALRETDEESGAHLSIVRLFAAFSLPRINQIYLLFLADLQNLEFDPGPESKEVRLFGRDDLPWKRLAFRAIEFTLDRYFRYGEAHTDVHLGSENHLPGGRWILAEED